MITLYPPLDEQEWPTLGPEVCAYIEDNLVYGPGDLLGEPVRLSEEQRAWIYRIYEVEPERVSSARRNVRSTRRNPRAGRRRFTRCVLSLRKGSAKTEFAAWLAIAELDREGPVRCIGWTTERGERVPVGGSVTDPYIPMIAYTEEQTEELAYGAARRILEDSPIAHRFDIGLERIMRGGGDGKLEAVSGSPNARDGARTTFQHFDETHRYTLESLREACSVMLANTAKRPLADPWTFETTTAPEPGAGSVAEATMEYARALAASPSGNGKLFFFHREASATHDLTTKRGVKAAIREASGPDIVQWSDVDRIADRFFEPDADRAYLERVWLNRPTQAANVAFDVARWTELARPEYAVPEGSAVALGFDGSRYDDATALVATHVPSGFQWPLGIWEPPPDDRPWEVPVAEVDGLVRDAFERWTVVLMLADPPKWESWIATWAGRYGEKVVLEWWTNRRKPMAYAIRAFTTALKAGELSHNGDARLTAHIGHARRLYTNLVDEERKPLWILRKERPDSPKKIDGAMAAVLSWEARTAAVASGLVEAGGWRPVE